MMQNLVVKRGEPFKEVFNLKKPDGSPSRAGRNSFYIVVSRREFVRRYPLTNKDTSLEFNLTAAQTNDFDSNVLSYKIVLDNDTKEVIAHGNLRVQ